MNMPEHARASAMLGQCYECRFLISRLPLHPCSCERPTMKSFDSGFFVLRGDGKSQDGTCKHPMSKLFDSGVSVLRDAWKSQDEPESTKAEESAHDTEQKCGKVRGTMRAFRVVVL